MGQIPSEVRQQIIEVLSSALESFGDVNVRAWGEVVSIDLSENSRKVFSVQIADRSVQLGEAWVGIWTGNIAVDALNDLIASKMVALVERGAPRDFRDIFTVCQQGLCQVNACWALWHQRQKLAKEDSDPQRAVLAIQTHLARLEKARPLERIEDEQQRLAAQQLRTWFHEVFVYGYHH
ncbi:MAG: nucleotidyl transferase AbiEii/AbiGii toxin family protein [Leptolinea sp.]